MLKAKIDPNLIRWLLRQCGSPHQILPTKTKHALCKPLATKGGKRSEVKTETYQSIKNDGVRVRYFFLRGPKLAMDITLRLYHIMALSIGQSLLQIQYKAQIKYIVNVPAEEQ